MPALTPCVFGQLRVGSPPVLVGQSAPLGAGQQHLSRLVDVRESRGQLLLAGKRSAGRTRRAAGSPPRAPARTRCGPARPGPGRAGRAAPRRHRAPPRSTAGHRKRTGQVSPGCRTRQPGRATSERCSSSSTRTTRQAALAVRARRLAVAHALDEVPALQPQRLIVGHHRAPDVARSRDVLAVVAVVLLEALVVDGQLALERHVVEGRHPARADDREAPLLVRVEPRQVQVRREAGGEAQVAEDDVLVRPRACTTRRTRGTRPAPPEPVAVPPRRRARRATRARSRLRAACRG